MPEQSPSQVVNDWVTTAQSNDTPKNKATKIATLYIPDTTGEKAALCATEGIIQGQSYISADYEAQFTAGWVLKGISNQSINQGTAANWAGACGQWTGTVPNSERRSGAGIFRRRHGRGDHHRPRPHPLAVRHRPQFELHLQGSARRREAGRPGTGCPLCTRRHGAQEPRPGPHRLSADRRGYRGAFVG